MSAAAPITTTTTTTISVPAEVHLTPTHTHILSLLRTTNVRISVTTTHLRFLRSKEHELALILPFGDPRAPGEIACQLLRVSTQAEIDALAARVVAGEDVGLNERDMELAWRYLRLDSVLAEIEKAKEEQKAEEEKKAYLEGALERFVAYEERKERGLPVAAEPARRPVFEWKALEVGWEEEVVVEEE